MRRRFVELCILGAVSGIGCSAHTPPKVAKPTPTAVAPPAAPADAEPAMVRATVTHPVPDRFHIAYTLPEPREALSLQRDSDVVRKHWAPIDAKLVHEDGHDMLVAPEPRTHFEVDLPTDDIQPDKDYRNYYTFTDGGRLLYTGHLAATAQPGWPGTVEFVGAEGESVIARGQKPGPTATLSLRGDGTYVYFGKAAPIATDDVIAVIDPGFPAEVRANLDTLLPQLFKLYGDGLGRPASAAEKPLFFASYAKLEEGASIGGGVMPPRVVNIDAEFAGSPAPTWVNEQIEYTIAHESAHLWNSDLYQTDVSWIAEGTADALAYAALHGMGRISDKDYLGTLSSTMSMCETSLAEGRPFSESTRNGHYKELYFCGHTIALLSAAASKEPLMQFLKDVYAGPKNQYDQNRWVEVLSAKDAASGAFVRTLVTDKLADPSKDLPNALKHAGIAFETAKPGSFFNQTMGGYALRAVLDPTCVAGLAFEGDHGQVAVAKTAGVCGDMQPGEAFTSVAGAKYPTQGGGDAWDAAIAQCKKTGFVSVGRKGKPDAKLRCAKTPRARPTYLAVTKAP